MSNTLVLILFAIGSCFFGNVNFAIIISKIKKKDIRNMGSGNPGTLNMSRNLGLGLGLLTFFLDVMKGVLPTLISFYSLQGRIFENSFFPVNDFAVYLCGLCAVLGHIFPVFMKFRGGKGIATTIGVFIVSESVHGWEWSIVAIMALVCAGVFIYITEFGAMGSFIAITPPAIGASIRMFLIYASSDNRATLLYYVITNMFILSICFITWFAHRKNIKRMLSGEEHPTSIKAMVVRMKAKKIERDGLAEKKSTDSVVSCDSSAESDNEKR